MKKTLSQQQIQINSLIKRVMDENNTLKLEILNYIIYLSYKFQRTFISQNTLATRFKVSKRWINDLLAQWKEAGALRYRQRGFNKTCIYFFNPLLVQERERLKWKLPALRTVLYVSSLCSAVFGNEFLLSNIRNIPIWKRALVPPAKYDFYEEQPTRGQSNSIVFLKNEQTIPTYCQSLPQKERVLEQTVINRLSETYGLSVQQLNMLSDFSEAELKYAFGELKRQNKQGLLNNPVNWISKVATAYRQKGQRSSNGKEGGHSAKPRNPHGHSPSAEVPNLTHIEQVEYLMNEILKFSKSYDPDKIYSPDASLNEYLKKIAMNSIASMQREVDQLLGLLDDPKHNCYQGCVDKSPFLRAPKEPMLHTSSKTTSDNDYEEHLDEISGDKSDSSGYKSMVRRYDYHRTARK